MSKTVYYKGVLKVLERFKGETLEEQCKRLLGNKDLPTYFDSYAEYLMDENYQEITIQNDIVYRVEKEEVDPYDDIFRAKVKDNGEIEFEVRYYNGGCGFDEAIEEAVRTMTQENKALKVIKTESSSQACPRCKSDVNWKYCSNCGQKLLLNSLEKI